MAQAHSHSPAELKAQIEAERKGYPFLVWRDGEGEQVILELAEGVDHLTVGRAADAGVSLAFDKEVSRLHAELAQIAADWTMSDDGLSRNGSFLNGDRAVGRKRLRDGDVLRFGNTQVTFRSPGGMTVDETHVAAEQAQTTKLSETQKKVLIALCRPYKEGSAYATPATNQQIADEIFLSVDAIKAHLRVLFEKFGVSDLAQNQKRAALVERAFQSGAIAPRDL
ncbi:MAG: hypothetical protein QOG62_887 [Thermoleophilaceae bacterium]|nr:hypothetical protein [Thermoleophilaceae bacterium]